VEGMPGELRNRLPPPPKALGIHIRFLSANLGRLHPVTSNASRRATPAGVWPKRQSETSSPHRIHQGALSAAEKSYPVILAVVTRFPRPRLPHPRRPCRPWGRRSTTERSLTSTRRWTLPSHRQQRPQTIRGSTLHRYAVSTPPPPGEYAVSCNLQRLVALLFRFWGARRQSHSVFANARACSCAMI